MQPRPLVKIVCFCFLLLWGVACDEAAPVPSAERAVHHLRHRTAENDPVVARVNGIAITASDVSWTLQQTPELDSPRAALDALISDALLADAAIARGYAAHTEATLGFRDALALAWMRHAGERIQESDLDEEELRKGYEARKEKYWHGEQRRMIHALVRTGKKGLEPAQARLVADQVAAAVAGVASEGAFRAAAQQVAKDVGVAKFVRVENLPPFDREYKKFVPPFVEKAFEIQRPGQVGKPFETSFGWHVVYFIETLPEVRIPFAVARAELAESLLAHERVKRVEAQIEGLYQKARIRISDVPDALETTSDTP